MAEVLRGGLRVALFLDYDGTLREIEPDPAAAAPTPAVRELLDALAADARLDVTIVSGRTPRDLDAFVGGYPFGMIAEHGASVRPPRSRAWEHLGHAAGDATGDAWRAEVLALMRARVESTPGSFVEEKRTSLVWHHRRSDEAAGERRARELEAELAPVAARHSLAVRRGKKIVEVTPAGVDKGTAVVRVLDESATPYGLVVVAGDDSTDESMLRLDLPNGLTIKVGPGPTAARHRVPTPASLRAVLRRATGG
jgi:trehalose 6-phosphate synthase/phosphatase